MRLYLDSSALVKRYLLEDGRAVVMGAMTEAEDWATSRLAYVETLRAIIQATGHRGMGARTFLAEWASFLVVELDDDVARRAVELAAELGLRSLDAMHLASALTFGEDEVALATWDTRLWSAARSRGFELVPGEPPG